MLGQAQQAFIEADVAYHRQRLVDSMQRTHRAHRPARVSWVQGLIDALSGKGHGSRNGAKYDGDSPVIRPAAAPHHATSH